MVGRGEDYFLGHKMKRCLDIVYKDVHINTHVYIQWNL